MSTQWKHGDISRFGVWDGFSRGCASKLTTTIKVTPKEQIMEEEIEEELVHVD